jgi:transcriptional regulator with XRE-family HTH domain
LKKSVHLMPAPLPNHCGTKATPGQYLRELRERLRMTVRDVERASEVIADEEGDERFCISSGHLSKVENDGFLPSLFKLFTIAAVYELEFHDLLRRYGVDGNRSRLYRSRFLRAVTHPTSSQVYGYEEKIQLPIRVNPNVDWETTQLVNRMVGLWGEIPAAFLLGCNPRRHTYGFIGLSDNSMAPLIRAGSLIMIDPERHRIARNAVQNPFQRPIYFIELRDGYRCAWCQLEGTRLMLIPHPESCLPIETFSLTTEADIVGQVVGVAMRLAPVGTPIRDREPTALNPSEVVK